MNILNKYKQSHQTKQMSVSLEGYEYLAGDDDKKEEAIRNDVHSLFVKDAEEDGVVFKHYRLFLGPVFSNNNSLDSILNKLLDVNKNDRLEIRIASPGGLLSEGFTIINLIKNNFMGRVDTIIDTFAASMASGIFIEGTRRMIYNTSDIMFHDFSSGFFGKSSEINTAVKHANEHAGVLLFKTLTDNGYLTQEEFVRLKDGLDFYFGSYEMFKRGIATHLIHQNEFIPRGFVLENPEKYGLIVT
mgnify:CR=1 FL=1